MSITENLENSPVTREKTTHNLGMIYKLPNVFMHSTPNSFLFIKISSYSALSFDRSISCYRTVSHHTSLDVFMGVM
jgi:hypothetical protein